MIDTNNNDVNEENFEFIMNWLFVVWIAAFMLLVVLLYAFVIGYEYEGFTLWEIIKNS